MTNRTLALIAILFFFTSAHAQEQKPGDDKQKASKKETKKEDAKKPATHKVEKKPFKIELSLKGTLEPGSTTEITFHPNASPASPFGSFPLTIQSAVEHGASVKSGDVLITLNTQRIDQIVQDIETDLKVNEASLKLSQEEIVLLKKAVPLEMTGAERADKHARENLKYFLEVARPESEKRVHNYVKSAAFYYEFAKEELRQLEKMYKANDLTEDTEQIVLKRQKHFVEMAANWFKEAEIERDYTLKTELPRREIALKESVEKEAILLAKAKATLAPMLNSRQQSLAKIRHEHDKMKARLDELKKDREAMTIKAPRDGIVYYGKFSRGQWEGATTMTSRLVPHANVSPHEILMTIVNPRPLTMRVQVEEKDVLLVKPGLEAKAKPTFNPDLRIPARVTKVSAVPASLGKFEAVVALDIPTGTNELMPGMACEVKLVPYSKKDALVVPNKSIVEEDDKHFVFMVDKKGKHEKREVRPGRTSGDRTEILDGLREGDEILPEAPADKTKPMDKGASP